MSVLKHNFDVCFQSPRTPSEVPNTGALTINTDVPVTVSSYNHIGSPQLSDDDQMVSYKNPKDPRKSEGILLMDVSIYVDNVHLLL